jgi:hypothetical protein
MSVDPVVQSIVDEYTRKLERARRRPKWVNRLIFPHAVQLDLAARRPSDAEERQFMREAVERMRKAEEKRRRRRGWPVEHDPDRYWTPD